MPIREIDNTIDRAVRLGRDNQKLIGLIEAHCSDARIVLEGGRGMVEAATGLPIGLRSIRCDHAAKPSGAASDLALLAEEFYRGNCIECPHRKLRGLPNLATWCHDRAAERARHEEPARRAAEERQRSLASRQFVRRHLRLTANDAGRELLDLLGRLDGREPDEESHQDAEERLVATVRAAPDLVSTEVVEALCAVAETGEPTTLRALTIWVQRASRLADRLLRIAVHLLAEGPNPHAAEVFVQFSDRATPQDVERIIDPLMHLAARVTRWEADARPAGLLAAAGVSLPVVLDAICRYLEGHGRSDAVGDDVASPAAIAVGGCAAEHLIHQEPGTASVLVPRLLEALPRAMSAPRMHTGSEAPQHAVIRGLRAAFLARPSETANAVDRVAPSRPVEERERLFTMYAGVIDPRDGVEVPVDARRVALVRVVARAMGDWGLDIAATAATVVKRIAASSPAELADSGRALVGTLLRVLGDRSDQARRLEMLADPTQRLLEEGRRAVRGQWLRSLATAVGHVVGANAELFTDAMALYDVTVTAGVETIDAAQELRRRLLSAFPALAASPGRASTLIPRLYSALVDTDVGVRAAAIDACQLWVTDPGYPLPELMRALVPAFLDDTYVAVHRAMIRAALAIPPLPADVGRAVVSLLNWASTYRISDPYLSSEAAAAAVYLARRLGPDTASHVAGLALGVARQFDDPRETRDVLQASAPYADRHPAWALLAVRLLARIRHWLDRDDPEPFIRQRLLEMSNVYLDGALEEIDGAVIACLPDHPGMAWCWIEILQAARMWEAAGRVVSVIAERIPDTVEYEPRRRYAHVMRAAVLVEAALAAGDTVVAHQLATSVSGETDAPALLVRWRTARRLTVEALGDVTPDRADRLQGAATRLRAVVATQPIARRRRTVEAYCRTLELLVDLARWDTAIQGAEENADRWRQAAMRKAELGASDVEGTALAPLVETIRTIDRPGVVDDLRRSLLTVPLPVLDAIAPRAIRSHPAVARPPRPPVGVCLLEMDGTPVSTLVLLDPDHVYDLQVTIHLPSWPDWAETLEVAFNAPTTALELPILTFRRPVDITTAGAHMTVSELGRCRLAGTQSSFAEPLVCDVIAEFRGGDQRQHLRVAGMPRLRVRAVDPARDAPYGQLHTEGELITFFDRLRGQGLPDDEVKAFCRFFAALVAAAKRLYADRRFRGGGGMKESQFQRNLEEILRADPRLEGRVKRVLLGGGITDLVHDGMVAELKVERTTPVTITGARKYLGQPTQYSVDADARLSILCILDWTRKDAPVGKPENYWGWLVPALHGAQPPSHPSIVGVLIINVNLPRPSSWSRRQIEASALDTGEPTFGFDCGSV